MRTAIVIQSPPTPPTPPLSQTGRDLGSLIRNSVGGALQSISAEVSRELAQALKEQATLQRQLDGATSSSQRAQLRQQLTEATVKVEKLQSAVDKLNSKVGDLGGNAAQSFPGTVPPYFPPQEQVPTEMIVSVISIIFIGFPLSIAFARLLWRRASSTPATSTNQLPAESARRFDELSHSVDAIAIEVERISENQRYLTKLLSEPRQNAAVGAGRGGAPPAS